MDYNVPVISLFSTDVMIFMATMAATFFTIVTVMVSYFANGFSNVRISNLLPIASSSIFVASIFAMFLSAQYAYQFSKNILVLHQVSEEADNFGAALRSDLATIFSEFKEGQSADGFMEEFNLYSDLAVRLEQQMDSIHSSLRGEDYADMKDFMSMCSLGESGSELYLTMGAYPPKKAALKSRAKKAMASFRGLNSSTAYPSGSEIPDSCVVGYLVPDFL